MVKNFILFGIGGIGYLLTELLWRGRSHWSMFVLGGLCFLLIGVLNERAGRVPPILRAAAGAVMITVLELVSGYILNIRLHMNVWSYAGMPFNIMGQVCLPYTLLWFPLAAACVRADGFLRRCLFGA